MGENTKIEWATHTFNPWIGCTKVSPACDNCYAEEWAKRYNRAEWGAGKARHRTSASNWQKPRKWNAEAERTGTRPRVFCASLADVFDNEVPPEWRADLFKLIRATPYLNWLLLTKRIGNAFPMMVEANGFDTPTIGHHKALPNVWIGATICNQEEANRDVPKLLAVPAAKRFLSMEPLLGNVDVFSEITGELQLVSGNEYSPGWLDWIIVGGESGSKARPMHPDWARSLRDQCQAAGAHFFFKQWGEWIPYEDSAQPPFLWSQHGHEIDGHVLPDFESGDGQRQREWHLDYGDMLLARRVGKKSAGRLLDGRTLDEVPG